MQPPINALPNSTRSAFSRMMAARAVDSVERSAAGGTRAIAHSCSFPPLPGIRHPQETGASSHGVASVFHSSAARHASDVAVHQPPRSASSLAPYVITDKTPRAELLAIIVQLQADLTQRTDSVNAIQRNFERLSSMHYAEQLELRRLRLCAKTRREAEPDSREAENRQHESGLAKMRQIVREQRAACAQLEEQLKVSRWTCALQRDVSRLIAAHAEGFREVLQEEAAVLLQLHVSAVTERAGICARHAETQQQLLCTGVAQLLADHHAQMLPNLIQGGATDMQQQRERSGEGSAAAILERVRQCLCQAAEAVHHRVAAAQAADLQRALAEAKSQCGREEAQRVLGETLHLRLLATEAEERRGRRALLFGELQARAVAEQTFDEVRVLRRKAEAAEAATRSTREATAALLTRRVLDWCAAADVRLVDFLRTVETSTKEAARELDDRRQETEQELLLRERKRTQDLHEMQMEAMRADWVRQNNAVQGTHEMQLAHVRNDLSAQIKVAEGRRVAAERHSRASDDALVHLKREHTAEVRAVEAHWRSAISDAVRDCERRWATELDEYQERQNACARAVLELVVDLLRTRGHYAYQEQDERATLRQSYWSNESHRLRGEQAATTQCCVTAAVLLERIEHHTQDEAAGRTLLSVSACEEWTALVGRERAHKAQVHHALSMAAAAARLEEVRAEAAEQAETWRQRLEKLQEDLREAKEERLAAMQRGSDAVLAAREVQVELHRLRQDFAAYRCGVSAAAHRIEVAESATESACCCSRCLELYCQPVACVPCGHIYCASCLLRHPRNRPLWGLTSSSTSAGGASSGESGAAGAGAGIEVAQWLRSKSDPYASLFCPECASANVSTVVELRALGELAAKHDYKKRSLAVLLAELR
ncbi:hypothetical protein LSCM4_07686 [Leishmania orientalis]|uniref:RING-type domain-containing protein n=1 Tax=Leishmania orientalis TaxID=2249476 RepID=A0A836L0W0_9TRYP|nr:hypothetical protein LSCM4_07686 [Leishmania orientalis]